MGQTGTGLPGRSHILPLKGGARADTAACWEHKWHLPASPEPSAPRAPRVGLDTRPSLHPGTQDAMLGPYQSPFTLPGSSRLKFVR